MKAHSRVLIVALAINLLIPTATLAEVGPTPSSSAQPEATSSPEVHSTTETNAPKPESIFSGNQSSQAKSQDPAKFCNNVGTIRQNISDTAKGKAVKLKADFAKSSEDIATKRTDLVKKISDNRLKSDTDRTQRFTELEAKAQTDTQKVAIQAYEAAIIASVAKHRATIDAADKIFLDGVTAAVGSRQADLMALSNAYQSGVATAIAQAKASCATNVAASAVRQNLSITLKALQAKFADGRKALDKARPNLDALKAAHKSAIAQANADFQSALKSAYAQLKAALGSTNASPKPSPAV